MHMAVPCLGGKLGCASRGAHLVAEMGAGISSLFRESPLRLSLPVPPVGGIAKDGAYSTDSVYTLYSTSPDTEGNWYACLIFLLFPCEALQRQEEKPQPRCEWTPPCIILYCPGLQTPEPFMLLIFSEVTGQETNNLNKLPRRGEGNPHRMFRTTTSHTHTYQYQTRASQSMKLNRASTVLLGGNLME